MFPKKILLVLISFLVFSPAYAAHIDLVWDPNSEPDLAGYRVYYGTDSQDYTDWIDARRATSVRITRLLDDAEYFIVLTAYDIYGNESDFSGEVSAYSTPGDQPALGPEASQEGALVDTSSKDGCFLTTTTL